MVTDKPDCGGAAFARAHGVPVLHWPDAGGGTPPLALASALLSARIRLLLLAGYLKLLPPAVVAAFPRAVLNVHPAPLPRFGGKGMYGAAVHAAVLASGLPFSGPTVHFVDGGYDTGPALCSRWDVPVVAGDTPGSLAARVLRAEWELYPAAVAAVVDGRVAWRRRGGRAGAAAGGGGGGGEAGDAGDEGVAEEEGGGDGDVWLPELLGGLAGAAAEVGDCTAAAPAGTSRTPGH